RAAARHVDALDREDDVAELADADQQHLGDAELAADLRHAGRLAGAGREVGIDRSIAGARLLAVDDVEPGPLLEERGDPRAHPVELGRAAAVLEDRDPAARIR